jgi:hypothetical protein
MIDGVWDDTDAPLDTATDTAGDGYEEGPSDGLIDSVRDNPTDAAADPVGNGAADIKTEGDRDKWGMAMGTKNSVSLVWFLIAWMCSGCHCVHADFAATLGPWEWAFCFPEHQ